ncbi:uncharacterized protein VTP21DRAFT_6071 [Calcarisporiella thermophila]|uniref:uncharacterized protein n=1 Tax=Calcarisporiella thermophila TaxID=911321 RepID=UPI003742E662
MIDIGNDNSIGFWSPSTSTVDWCEKNYQVSNYIAEYFNTLSSLFISIIGLIGLFLHYEHERRVRLLFCTLFIVGLGSTAFHGTLLFPGQMMDESSMIFMILTMFYCAVEMENTKCTRFGPWFPLLLVGYGSVITTAMFVSGNHKESQWQLLEFVIFQASFISLAFICYLYILYYSWRNWTKQRAWLLSPVAQLAFAIAYAFWLFDVHLCHRLRQGFNLFSLNIPYPQLHAWWHVLSSFAMYLFCTIFTFTRSSVLRSEPTIAYFGFLPYVRNLNATQKKIE